MEHLSVVTIFAVYFRFDTLTHYHQTSSNKLQQASQNVVTLLCEIKSQLQV